MAVLLNGLRASLPWVLALGGACSAARAAGGVAEGREGA
jgi:hypothetical protein